MIIDLPKMLPVKFLYDFDLGNGEAKHDSLLKDTFIFTQSINEILKGRKRIIVGDKGCGKTALIEMVKNGLVSLPQRNHKRHLIVIENKIDYLSIRDTIANRMKMKTNDNVFRYEICWELYLVYRMAKYLSNEEFRNNEAAKELFNLFDRIVNDEMEFSLSTLFRNFKYTLKFAVKQTNATIAPYPEAGVSVEPSESQASASIDLLTRMQLSIDEAKEKLNDICVGNGIHLDIMADKLDEFVVKDEYPIQIAVMEAIINCVNTYEELTNINLFAFIRTDVYKSINGFDLVKNSWIVQNLEWTNENIKWFVGRRLMKALQNVTEMPAIRIRSDNELCEIVENDHDDCIKRPILERVVRKIPKIGKRFFNHLEAEKARKVNFTDEFIAEVLKLFFPDVVDHYNSSGKIEKMKVNEYLATHFSIGNNVPIPRFVLLYLRNLFAIAQEYWQSNPDKEINLTGGRYSIFVDGQFRKAYTKTQNEVCEYITKLNHSHTDSFEKVISKRGGRYVFNFKDIINILSCSEDECANFIKYAINIGYFENKNGSHTLSEMKLELPYIYRKAIA